MVAQRAGTVRSAQGPVVVADVGFEDCPHLDVLLIPGGPGTRGERFNEQLLGWLADRSATAELTTSVCTGSLLLASAGVLDGRRATTNKLAFDYVAETRPAVTWVREARWVDDGEVITSSGVSAGMDMTLHLISRLVDVETSERLATGTEYEWHRDSTRDPFANLSD